MSRLPKHCRPRWRYLAVRLEGWPEISLDRRSFQAAVWSAARDLFGDAGSASLDLTVVRFDLPGPAGHAIVRTRRGETDRGRAVLACVDAVDGTPIGTHVAGISGTLRACEEKYIGRAPEDSEQRHVVFEAEDRPATVRGERVDVRTDEGISGATDLDCE